MPTLVAELAAPASPTRAPRRRGAEDRRTGVLAARGPDHDRAPGGHARHPAPADRQPAVRCRRRCPGRRAPDETALDHWHPHTTREQADHVTGA
ncbi:hypothetical protein ACFQVA_02365 [Actinomadura keratinilytica]